MVHAASAASVFLLRNAAEAACTVAPKQSSYFLETTLVYGRDITQTFPLSSTSTIATRPPAADQPPC